MTTEHYTGVEVLIGQMAEKWGCKTTKTIEHWTEFAFQSFGHSMPKKGPFYHVDVFLLDLVGMHLSTRASEFYRVTGESRRLKGNEFVEKVRSCFEAKNFNKFSKVPGFLEILEILAQTRSDEAVENDDDDQELDDTAYASMSAIVRSTTSEIGQFKQAILRNEDQELEELADTIKNTKKRRMKKLAALLGVTVEEIQTDSDVNQLATAIYKPASFRR